MIVETLSLIAGAALGQFTSVTYQWASKKAGENNPEIEKALIAAYCKTLQVIRHHCERLPEWDIEKAQIEARLADMERDASIILDLVQAQRQQSTPAFEVSSLAVPAQQQITQVLMVRLRSEDKWLKDSPHWFHHIVEGEFVPVLVYQFRHELKHEPTVFRSLIHDMLAAAGEDVSRLVEVTTRIDERFDEFVGAYRQDVDRIINLMKPPLPVPADFAALIADKTQGFVGREFVFEAIANFIQTQQKGYFTVVAPPGFGKSSILAKYVQNTGCIAYFNQLSQGRTSAEDFLKSVCTQLIDRYYLPYQLPLHPDNTGDGNFLSKLLHEISAKLTAGERAIIAVDALDEVDLNTQRAGVNVLYLPATLPNNVYFILSRQPKDVPFAVNPQTPQMIFDLRDYGDRALEDIKTYIRVQAQSAKLQQWMRDRQLSEEEFIAQLAKKSENNFMYLRFVLPEIERGAYQNIDKIENLPQGLEQYYEQHWARMKMTEKPLPRRKLKIIYLLSKTRQPVTCDLLADFGEEDPLDVQELLDEWEQFLRRSSDEPPEYSIYHGSFQTFLHRKDIVQKAGVSLRDIESAIARNLIQDLYGDE